MSFRDFYWTVKEFLAEKRKSRNVIAGQDGRLYEVVDHLIGRVVLPIQHVPDLDNIQKGFQFKLPKVPKGHLEQILSFFRYYCNEWNDVEAFVQIYWDREEENYILVCPQQSVSKGRVEAEFEPRYLGKNNTRFIQVIQIHSHNSMPAYFSGTDNNDETGFTPMIYGVAGRLNQEQAEFELRVGYNGGFVYLPLDYIFEEPTLERTDYTFPKEWNDRVMIR